MNGNIFNLQRFCIDDGPGIRSTVFFKGCPLKCIWCHNPESQNINPEILYTEERCINCKQCVALCAQNCHSFLDEKHIFQHDKCVACGNCINASCGALALSGKKVSVDDILQEVMTDKAFYDNSGGGITLSGGEPFFQKEFCLALLTEAKKLGLHTCLETCGLASEETIKSSAEFVDLYLYDYKETDPIHHKQLTGVDNHQILTNLKLLDNMGKQTILRCPIIPDYNDTDVHFKGIAQVANSLTHLIQVELLPYHRYGEAKYAALGRKKEIQNIHAPDQATISLWVSKVTAHTERIVIHR